MDHFLTTKTKARIRILIADDHEIVREGIVSCIKTQDDFEIVGLAKNGLETLHRIDELSPDVLLLDIQMPLLDGHDILKALKERAFGPKSIVISTFSADDIVRRALLAGAMAYLLKDAPREEIWETIRKVAKGQTVVKPSLLPRSHEALNKAPLTNRELDVLGLMAKGHSNKQIGLQLSITEGTAKTHVFAIMEKLGANGRTEAVVIAARRGILELSGP
jgi:DNA-binding NarL/FixJ family response regulator